jgi:hypothetical protein
MFAHVQCDSLQPGTSYRVRVAAESAGGRSDYSETCFITTEPVCPDAPGPPTLLDKPKVQNPSTVRDFLSSRKSALCGFFDVEKFVSRDFVAIGIITHNVCNKILSGEKKTPNCKNVKKERKLADVRKIESEG